MMILSCPLGNSQKETSDGPWYIETRAALPECRVTNIVFLMTPAIYLSGSTIQPVEQIGPIADADWRMLAMTKLQLYGFRVLNPLELSWPATGHELELDSQVRRALDLIGQCDALLANISKPSYGTAMEMFYAYRQGKMVTVIGMPPFSPWVLSHSQARFRDIDKALDYLIGEQPQADPINWSLQYEMALSQHYEQFPPEGESDFQFLGGDLPVLVLAPHATGYFRDGEFQEPDAFTGSMAALLNRSARCHSLISSFCCVADPCWHFETPMRRAIADIAKTGQVGLVVVLLGAAWHESPGIFVHASGPDKLSYEDLGSRLRLQLSEIEPVATEHFDRSVGPLTNFIADELGVNVLTVKMHKRYRMPRLQPRQFLEMVLLLDHFVSQTGVDLLQSRS